jgi:hypothetical protein
MWREDKQPSQLDEVKWQYIWAKFGWIYHFNIITWDRHTDVVTDIADMARLGL